MTESAHGIQRVVLVTGPSGAGKTRAIAVLEDLGYESIDNLPLGLVPRLLQGGPSGRPPLALAIDARNRDFSTQGLIDMVDWLAGLPGVTADLVFLDCRPEILLRRFSETRRRHPLAPAESPQEGINREFDLLGPVRDRADVLIDTSDLSPHELRDEISRWCAPEAGHHLAVAVHSFSYKRGLPRGLDMLFDCRFLANPYWEPDLRDRDGRAADVAAHVRADARFAPFFDRVLDLTRFLLPAHIEEGKAHFAIGFGCTGGRHRSVATAEALAAALAQAGWQVSIRHRELERVGPVRDGDNGNPGQVRQT
ncbi:MAG: RNase adapter RapZ [Paracoccaceae bacterium]